MEGRDPEDHPFSFLKSVSFSPGSGRGPTRSCDQEPYQIDMKGKSLETKINLVFHAHYEELPLTLPLKVTGGEGVLFMLG